MTAIVMRVITMAVPVILIPVTFRDFGPETYAVWSTVVATTSMFLWADLGLGNGLLTTLSPMLAKGDSAGARRSISAAYSTLGLASLLLVLGVIAGTLTFPIPRLLGVESELASATVAICFCLLFANVPFALVHRVQYAAQEASINNLMQATGPVTVLLGALVSVHAKADPLVIITVIALGPLLSSALTSFQFYSRRPELAPRLVKPWGPSSRLLMVLGGQFLIIQVLSAIALNSDPIVAAHSVSDGRLSNFTVTLRLFAVMGSLVSVVTLPLWPANAEAINLGDANWIRRTTLRASLLAGVTVVLGGIFATAAALIGGTAVLGPTYEADLSLLIGLTVMWAVVAATSPLFMAQNAAGILRPQLTAWPVFFICSVGAKVMVTRYVGVEWIPLAGAVIYMFTVSLAAVVGYRLLLRRVNMAVPR